MNDVTRSSLTSFALTQAKDPDKYFRDWFANRNISMFAKVNDKQKFLPGGQHEPERDAWVLIAARATPRTTRLTQSEFLNLNKQGRNRYYSQSAPSSSTHAELQYKFLRKKRSRMKLVPTDFTSSFTTTHIIQ
ncbi:hypothetical protein CBL_14597 [Carabus blaptoides fortunei]